MTWAPRCAVTILIVLSSTPALAQSFMPMPNQLSIGMGVVGDGRPAQAAALVFSFAFADSGNSYWPSRFGFVFEGEANGMSYAGACEDCGDGALWVGTRFHFFRRSQRRVLPFVDLVAGSYWRVDDPSPHTAFQTGGGIDFLRSGSVHGLRLSVDYRRVLADEALNQFRFVTSYVLGPPRR